MVEVAEPDLVLEFEIEEGRSPDIENVARALLAWNEAVQAAVRAIDPNANVTVELLGVEPGSQRFKQVFSGYESIVSAIYEGGKEYPHLFRHGKALGKLIAGGIVLAAITTAMQPAPVAPKEEMQVLEDIRSLLQEDVDLKRSRESFYEILQGEPAIKLMEVFEGDQAEPIYSVPRSEFGLRSGLFEAQQEPTAVPDEVRKVRWEVVLIKPVLVGTPRRWTFARDGLEFSALMTDKAVLQALHDKTLSIPFAEGVLMQVEMTYKERSEGEGWIPLGETRRITKVLSPRVPVAPAPLFADADSP